jgi:hypothetical protein
MTAAVETATVRLVEGLAHVQQLLLIVTGQLEAFDFRHDELLAGDDLAAALVFQRDFLLFDEQLGFSFVAGLLEVQHQLLVVGGGEVDHQGLGGHQLGLAAAGVVAFEGDHHLVLAGFDRKLLVLSSSLGLMDSPSISCTT